MTPKMARSTVAEIRKQLMGLLLQRASRRALSMELVVRTFFQCSLGRSQEGQ